MNMNLRPVQLSAFTLIELIVALAIFSVILVALYSFFVGSNSTFLYQRAFINSSASAATVVNDVASAGLPADQVLASHVFGGTTRSSSANTLVLELPSIDGTGSILSGSFDYIVFYTDGSYVYETIAPASGSARHAGTTLLTNALSSLSFGYDNTDFTQVTSVNMDIRTESTLHSQVITDELHQVIYLRNKS